MCLLLVNLLLLASLKEKSIYGELDCLLRMGDGDGLEEDDLVDEATRNRFCYKLKILGLVK